MSAHDEHTVAVQALVDRQAILDCIHRCARGVDRHDDELILSAYHPDAIDDHGSFKGSPQGFVDSLKTRHSDRCPPHHHHITNHTVEIDGDTAHAETYFVACMAVESGDVTMVGGRYVDRLERRDGEWRIFRRVCIAEWMGRLDARGNDALSRFTPGATDRSDVSYQRPLEIDQPV